MNLRISNYKLDRAFFTVACAIAWLVQNGSIEAQVVSYPTDSYATAATSWNSGWGENRWLGSSATNGQWRLGIDGTNTQTGVVVNQVEPGSPAARAGINRADIIVNVAGDQVGNVAGKIFELTEELNHNADSRGRVELLVQDGRSLRLRPLQIQLDDRQPGLTGMVVIPERRLPADSIVTIQLENVSRPHYVVRNGQYSFRVPTYAGGSIPFNLNYDPSYVFASDTYRVRAYITSGGRTIFDTTESQYVLTRGNPSSVQLRLAPSAYITVSGSNVNNGAVFTAGYANYDVISQRVSSAYQQHLGRSPSAMELAAWQQVPDIEFRLTRLPLELMASQEYFDLVGNNNVVWVRKVFGEVIGRTPTALELDQWMRRFSELRYSRMELLTQMQSITPGR